jgi:hypothetical protein
MPSERACECGTRMNSAALDAAARTRDNSTPFRTRPVTKLDIERFCLAQVKRQLRFSEAT